MPTSGASWPSSTLRGRDLLLILGLLFLGVVLLNLIIGSVAGVGDEPPNVLLVVGVLALQSALTVGIIGLVAMGLRGASWSELGFRAVNARWIAAAVGIALLTMPPVWILNAIVQSLFETPVRNPQLEFIAPEGFSWSAMIAMTIATGTMVPIAEELAFRGILYGWIRRRFGIAAGVAGSASAFALIHGIPTILPAILFQGVVLALVYERSRSLWPPIIVHGTFNGTSVLLLYAALAMEMPGL